MCNNESIILVENDQLLIKKLWNIYYFVNIADKLGVQSCVEQDYYSKIAQHIHLFNSHLILQLIVDTKKLWLLNSIAIKVQVQINLHK